MTKKYLLLFHLFLLSTCGKQKPDSNQNPEKPITTSTDGLRLKGVGLLAQSLYQTLGAKKNISANNGNEDLFATYSQNFGNSDGLRFGEVYADSPSTSYMLALAILAGNAAVRCEEEITQGTGTQCQCNTTQSGSSMLRRAFPKIDFNDQSRAGLVEHFVDTCKKDYRSAISSLISSIGFAAR